MEQRLSDLLPAPYSGATRTIQENFRISTSGYTAFADATSDAPVRKDYLVSYVNTAVSAATTTLNAAINKKSTITAFTPAQGTTVSAVAQGQFYAFAGNLYQRTGPSGFQFPATISTDTANYIRVIQAPVYYSGTGVNTDGAMTQAATTLGLGGKQNAYASQMDYTVYNTGQTMAASYQNQSVNIYGDGSVNKFSLPPVTVAAVGSVLRLYSVTNNGVPLNVSYYVPGNPSSTFPGGNIGADSPVAVLNDAQTVCLAVVKVDRPIPYNDSIGMWVVTSLTSAAAPPPLYYSGTGVNTDGAMTQKATTTALATKQSTFTEQLVYGVYNTGQTIPVTFVNKLLQLDGNGLATRLALPAVTLSDIGTVISLELRYNDGKALDLYFVAPGNPNSTFAGAKAPYDYAITTINAQQVLTLGVVKVERGTPYRDTAAVWAVIGANNTAAVNTKSSLVAVSDPQNYVNFVKNTYYAVAGSLYLRTGNNGGDLGSTAITDTTNFQIVLGGPTPSAIRTAVTASGATWTNGTINGELQGAQPTGSKPGMKFCGDAYRYEFMNGTKDADGTSFIWVRTAKA